MSYDTAVVAGAAAMAAGLVMFVWLLAGERTRRRIRSGGMVPMICTRPELGHDGPCNGFPAETCWQHISVCPPDVLVFVKHANGPRNPPTHFRLRRSK